MWKTFLGPSPWTTMIGILIAALMVVVESLKAGETNWLVITGAVLVAILGRIVKGEEAPLPPAPTEVTPVVIVDTTTTPPNPPPAPVVSEVGAE